MRYLQSALIVVLGTVCLDRTRWISAFPPPGGYVEIDRETVGLGGEAANTAVALRNWGDDVWLGGNDLGEGPEADLLKEELAKAGVVWHPIGDRPASGRVAPGRGTSGRSRTPVCDIYVTPDGDRTMFGKGFRDMEPEFLPALTPLAPGSWLTAEPNMPTAARRAVRAAAQAGMRTYVMDFIRDDEELPGGSVWQSSTDWAGRRGETYANIEWLVRWVRKHRCFAVLTDGANGCVAGSPDHPVRAYPAYSREAEDTDPSAANSTGAGDVFRAGMLHGLSRGWAHAKAIRFASAAGYLRYRSAGAAPWPSVEEIERLIEAHPEVAF